MPKARFRDQLNRLKARIQAQNGTVLEKVEGEVEIDDVDEQGHPRKGPILVLQSIEEGSQLKLAHPRPVTVLGSLSGQVFGAYRVKAGNLLSGRLEGARHVEIVHNLGSKDKSNVDAWIVFEATSDPGFFDQAQQGLDTLRELECHQQPQREATAQQILLRALKDVPYDIKVFVVIDKEIKPVMSVLPGRRGRQIELRLQLLLRYLLSKAESQPAADRSEVVEHFKRTLQETISESLRLANSGGIGASLRRQQGTEVFKPYVEIVCEYLLPKLLKLWLKVSETFVQRIVDRLGEAPMVLKVDGQLAPFFQIEYPRWKFHVTGSKIAPEKIADCNIACQIGDKERTMNMTYNYVGGDDWISQTLELHFDKTRKCQLIFKNGHVYLNDENHCIFGPRLQGKDGPQDKG